MGIRNYKYCPLCGKQLIYILDDYNIHLCMNSACRTVIENYTIKTMDLYDYSLIQENYNITAKKKDNIAYMLLRENLSGPMFTKHTNSPLVKNKNAYCIIRATSKKDAIEQFKQKYTVLNITDDMVVEVEINEI